MKTSLFFPAIFLATAIAFSTSFEMDASNVTVPAAKVADTAVSIEDMGKYYLVTIDMKTGMSHYQIGQQYGRCIKKIVPNYEDILNSYLWQLATFQGLWFNKVPERIDHVKPQLEPAYLDELNGLASQMSGTADWTASQLIFGFNLIPDVFRRTQCSAFGCWGASSENGRCVAYRTLDWWGGLWKINFPKIQSVTKIMYPTQTIYLIGALGSLGCITGINYHTGVMAAILDADIGTEYHSAGMRSYNFDLRHALENSVTKEQIAGYLTDPSKSYAFGHLIFLADDKNCVMLENNISKTGTIPQRALRYDTSDLNDGIVWNHKEIIGSVNCFMLRGQPNNYSEGAHAKINTRRWELMQKRTADKIKTSPGQKLSAGGIREIMCSYWGNKPKSLITKHGDLYNSDTQQMMLYIPEEKSLKVFFKRKDNSTPTNPVPEFVEIPLSQ